LDFQARPCSTRAVKRRLMDYRDNDRRYDNQVERLQNLTDKMYTMRIPELSDMPRTPSTVKDRVSVMVAQKDEVERDLQSLRDHQKNERAWIELVTGRLKNPDEQTVILVRYVDGESWNDVLTMLYGSKEDFREKEESYRRQTMRLHKRAISKIADAINREWPTLW